MNEYNVNEYLKLLDVSSVWKHGFTGKNINVAVVEDEVLNIPDKLSIKGWFDTATNKYTTSQPTVSTLSDHGFSSASLIAGTDTGVAPNCNLYNVIVNTDLSDLNNILSSTKKAIKWCIANNMDIINMSMEVPVIDSELISLAKEACEKNIIIVASLGNSSKKNKNPFLFSDCVLGIGAIDKNKNLCDFSNYDDYINFVSFGDAVPAYNSKGQLINFSGTSCSAPLISGLIALLKEQKKDLSYKEIQYILKDNSEKLSFNIKGELIEVFMPKACLIPYVYKKEKEIKDIESKIDIEDINLECETTLVEGDSVNPIISVYPKILNNQDILVTASDESILSINHFSNSIKALKSGKTTLSIWIPKRNIKKDIEFNILSTLEGEVKTFLDKYNVTSLHKNGFTGNNIKVAILDSGINKVGNIDSVNYAPNYIAFQPTSSTSDVYGQGTVTASIVKSIAPNCTLYSLKNQSNAGYNCTNESLKLKSLQWCIDNKMDIVIARNLELGSYANKDKLFKQMNDANIITIVSQLSGDSLKFSSNSTSNVLCVGLLNTNKRNDIGYIDVTCYEDGFPVYDKDGYFSLSTKLGFKTQFGIVGGICALLKQQNPNLNVTKLRTILPSICTNIGEFKYFGYGIMKAGLI